MLSLWLIFVFGNTQQPRSAPQRRSNQLTLKLCFDDKLLCRAVPADIQHIRLATDLAILNVMLMISARFIHYCLVPLSASGALKPGGILH